MAFRMLLLTGLLLPSQFQLRHSIRVRRVHPVQFVMNAGPNSTTFTLAPILFPTQLRATASGFAASVAKIGATLGVFVLPVLKGRFGVPVVLAMMAAVSVLGLIITLIFGRE